MLKIVKHYLRFQQVRIFLLVKGLALMLMIADWIPGVVAEV